jgi:hypothetical protein
LNRSNIARATEIELPRPQRREEEKSSNWKITHGPSFSYFVSAGVIFLSSVVFLFIGENRYYECHRLFSKA